MFGQPFWEKSDADFGQCSTNGGNASTTGSGNFAPASSSNAVPPAFGTRFKNFAAASSNNGVPPALGRSHFATSSQPVFGSPAFGKSTTDSTAATSTPFGQNASSNPQTPVAKESQSFFEPAASKSHPIQTPDAAQTQSRQHSSLFNGFEGLPNLSTTSQTPFGNGNFENSPKMNNKTLEKTSQPFFGNSAFGESSSGNGTPGSMPKYGEGSSVGSDVARGSSSPKRPKPYDGEEDAAV